MFRLAIEKLEHGWTDLAITLGDQNLLCIFEYTPNDALYELLLSAYRAARNLDSAVIFHDGPETMYYALDCISDGLCKITVGLHSMELPVKHYVRAVLRMFDTYLHTHSKDEYVAAWRHSFPLELLVKVRKAYKALD